MLKLLQLLESDCTLTWPQLAAMTGMTEDEVGETIKKLESDHVIEGYQAVVNWDRTDRETVTALIEVKVTPQRGNGYDRVAQRIYQYDEVESIYLMSGAYDFTVIVSGRTLKEVAEFVGQRLAPLEGVTGTATHFILRKYKERHVLFQPKEPQERELIFLNYDRILSDRIQAVQPSGIRKFFDILAEMDDAISLGVGEPDFVTPWHIRDAGIYSLEKGHTRYTSNAGMMELRKEISAYLYRRFDLRYPPAKQIIVTVGGSEAIDLALRCLIDPGDEVIVPVPSFVCYPPLVSMAGGVPVLVETKAEDEFRLTPKQLRAHLTPKTKAVVLPFPCNPTGGILERSDLEALAQVLEGTDVMLLSDEIYAELTYGQHHVSPANLLELYDRTIVVNGFSKSHAMTGWRMGYLCAPQPLITQMLKLHQFGIMSAPTMSQYAAIEALRAGDPDIEHMKEEYDGRRRFLVNKLNELGLPCFEPRGAFYVFPDIRSTGLTSDEFCERLLREEKVAVISGSAFGPGGEGFVRCCYATGIKEIAEAMDRLERFLARL